MKSALIVLMGVILAALGFLGGWVLKGDLDVQTVSNDPAVVYGGACCCGGGVPTIQVVVTVEVCNLPAPTSTSTATEFGVTPTATQVGPTSTRTIRPTDTREPKPTTQPIAGPTSTPEPTATVEPTQTPEPTATNVEPSKTPKPKCNKGSGNGGEDCDPGNNPDNGNDDED